MPILKRRCPVDGREFDLMSVRGELSALDHPDLDHLGCPDCGAEGEAIVGSFFAKDLGGPAGVGRFPYFDHGLGCEVRDAKHHRWLMTHHPNGQKRDAPLRPTHGDFDPAEGAAEQARLDAEVEKRAREQQEYMEHGPDRGAYAKLQEILKDPNEVARLWGE